MIKANSVVASVTQQSRQRLFHSLGLSTENSWRPHKIRRHGELMTTGLSL